MEQRYHIASFGRLRRLMPASGDSFYARCKERASGEIRGAGDCVTGWQGARSGHEKNAIMRSFLRWRTAS
jgi:hypothetical protein